jgi:hypothetical protein
MKQDGMNKTDATFKLIFMVPVNIGTRRKQLFLALVFLLPLFGEESFGSKRNIY